MLHEIPALLAILQDTGDAASEGPSPIWMFALIGAIFWFVLIAPDRKARKQRQAMLDELKKGQEVMTTGGILGKVIEVRDDRVLLQVSSDTRIHFARQAIQTVLDPAAAKEAKAAGKDKGDGPKQAEIVGKVDKDGAKRGVKED